MLIEQAFAGLPEFFCGPLYPPPENEANVVASIMLAVLQEVNGRNASHPLAAVERERLYQVGGFNKPGTADHSYLRADLYVNYGRVGQGTLRLSAYGWRFNNWMEVKYFRNGTRQKTGKNYTDGTKRTGLLAADLARLACLVPESGSGTSSAGRYLLHVYDDDPSRYVSFDKNRSQNSPLTFHRKWLRDLYKPGWQVLSEFRFDQEGKTFRDQVGSLADLTLKLGVTNLLVAPHQLKVKGKLFWLCLARIETIEASTPGHHFTITTNRDLKEDAPGDFQAIRDYVGSNIGLTDDEEEPPTPDVLEPPPVNEDESSQRTPTTATPEAGRQNAVTADTKAN